MSTSDGLNATIISRRDINPSYAIFRIRPDEGGVPDFHPGQFVMLGLPKPADEAKSAKALDPALAAKVAAAAARRGDKPRLIKRAYSIASPPSDRDALEFFVVLVDEGRLTPLMWKLHEGDKIYVESPAKGEFTLDHVAPGRVLVMISTGTGVAPFISMIKMYHKDPPWRKAVLIYGSRYARDLGYVDEMEAISKADPRIVFVPMVTREPADSPWKGLRGRVHEALRDDVFPKLAGTPLDPAYCSVLMCGNPDMIDEVQKGLEPRGFRVHSGKEPGTIHYERYW